MMETDFTVQVNIDNVDELLFTRVNRAQKFFVNELFRLSDDYTPFRQGILKSTGRIADNNTAIVYNTPYARYMWYGKLMVDPITKKGAFYDPRSGRFWSRPNTPKELTDRDLRYYNGPLRGPRWVMRAWVDYKDSLLKSVEKYVNGGIR